MKKILLLAVFSLVLVACDRPKDRPNADRNTSSSYNADNTAVNARDRNMTTPTSFNQSENEADRAITQKIRQAIMADNSLSNNAKNIKIITSNGVVILRGPVASNAEKELIMRKINGMHGITRVNNNLEVTRTN